MMKTSRRKPTSSKVVDLCFDKKIHSRRAWETNLRALSEEQERIEVEMEAERHDRVTQALLNRFQLMPIGVSRATSQQGSTSCHSKKQERSIVKEFLVLIKDKKT